jgi:hypothetical protein
LTSAITRGAESGYHQRLDTSDYGNVDQSVLVSLKMCIYFFGTSGISKNINIKTYRAIILPVVLYGCGTWSVTLREEHRLRVFCVRLLRTRVGPKRDEVTGEWRRLHNEQLCALYTSPDIMRVIKSRRMRWASHVARMGDRKVHTDFGGRPEGRTALGGRRYRWVDNINMDVEEVNWIYLAHGSAKWWALVNAVMKLRFT